MSLGFPITSAQVAYKKVICDHVRLNAVLFVFFCQVRYKLGLSDDEEDEIDSADQPRSDKDLCHPLCQCEKCSKWQKVCDITARHAKYRLD